MVETTEYTIQDVVQAPNLKGEPMVVKEYKKIGEGAFGTVVKAQLRFVNRDTSWLGSFAIKRVPAETDYKLRELDILRVVSHPNIIKLKFYFNKRGTDSVLYQNLVMEVLPLTLQEEIRFYRKSKYTIPYPHMKAYIWQLTRAMLYLHGFSISHRDIKPSNILVDPNSVILKICDFGSAKKLEFDQPSVSYICLRYYRAPELIIGCALYTTKIDIWGLGCVIAEMFLGRAVFQGSTPEFQLKEIAKLLGPPSNSFFFKNNPNYHGNMFSSQSFDCTVKQRFESIFSNSPPDAIDLLMKIFVYEPDLRASPRRILAQPFFNELKSPEFLVVPRDSQTPIQLNLFDFSKIELDLLGSLSKEVLGR